eukprot:c45374_g1_i1.p1 GENE.c45374_g1_i1~~c45374_g1_i1.p1  ORF type:complete len:2244 (+),score=641.62 c45374_g1_i1:112-6843(+)
MTDVQENEKPRLKLLKRDDNVFVRINDVEYPCTIVKDELGKMFAEYRVPDENGESTPQRVPLRKKKNAPSARGAGENHLLHNANVKAFQREQTGGSNSPKDDLVREQSVKLKKTETPNELKPTQPADLCVEDFEEDFDGRQEIIFKPKYSEQEKLVLEYFADDLTTTLEADAMAKAKGKKDKEKTKKVDLDEDPSVFKWTYDEAPSAIENIDAVDDFDGVEGRDEGVVPATFDLDLYNHKRANSPFINNVPASFKEAFVTKPRDQLLPRERITTYEEMRDCSDPLQVKYIHLDHTFVLNKQTEQSFYNVLNQFTKCEILVLRNLGLRRVDRINMHKLSAADLMGNQISDLRCLKAFCKNSPHLFQLDVRHNPIGNRPVTQELIADVFSLTWFCGEVILEKDRAHAVAKFATPTNKALYQSMQLWEQAVMLLPPVRHMRSWEPHILVHLTLTNVKLDRIFVGTMVKLQVLNVSKNNITTLKYSGLERLENLTTFNISHNLLSSVDDIEMLQWIPSLQHVDMHHNKWPQAYRMYTVWICRNLRGTNHQPGLLRIDGQPVEFNETIEAWRTMGRSSESEIDRLRWQYALIQYAGHYHLRLPNFTEKFRVLRFAKMDLPFANLTGFPKLVILNLSGCGLKEIFGLDALESLEDLDLSRNPLSLTEVLASLKTTSALRDVSLAPTEAMAADSTYRRQVVSALFHHPFLRRIDNLVISHSERLYAYNKAFPHASRVDVESYSINLKLTMSATNPNGRAFTPTACEAGVQWSPDTITRLTDLSHLGLTQHADVGFASFVCLVQLNLSHNKIRDIVQFRLHDLEHLEILDVSHNLIHNTIPELADYFDKFKAINTLCLRGNQTYNSMKHRLELIGRMTWFRKFDCPLRVVDTLVTFEERTEAWKDQGGDIDAVEQFKFRFQLQARLPNVPPEEVRYLNLNQAGLEAVSQLLVFANIKTLVLRHNSIESIEPLVMLQALELVDVRGNSLKSLEECVEVINALPCLKAIAVADNPFSKGNKYRSLMVSKVSKLMQIDNIFHFLDDIEIVPSEIVKFTFKKHQPKATRAETNRWEWATVVWREAQKAGGESKLMTELNLGHRELKMIDFGPGMFPKLSKLSLAYNSLEAPGLKSIFRVTALRELDLTGNQIDDVKAVGRLVDGLPNLTALFVEDNPCFKEDTEQSRVSLLSQLQQVQSIKASLKFLNGAAITVLERVKALELSLPPGFDRKNLDEFQTELAIDEIGLQPDSTQASLNSYHLRRLGPLLSYSKIQYLDLSDNKMETLIDQGIEMLTNLLYLDLRKNNFTHLHDGVLIPLTKCHNLRHLFLEKATKSETHRVNDYLVTVCRVLRGLESVDQVKNPLALDRKGWQGAQYLFDHYQLSCNSLLEIDLSERNLEEAEFPKFCTALSQVYCEKLKCENNPWAATPNYRFLLIHFGRTLVELDGRRVAMDERANAQRTVEAMKLDKRAFFLEKNELAIFGAVKAGVMQLKASMEAEAAAGANGSAGPGAGAGAAISSTIAAMGLGAIGQEWDISQAILGSPVGTLLSKGEIIINFLQVYAILFTLTIKWPDWWYNFNIRWVFIVDIDLNLDWLTFLSAYQYLLKFILLIIVPIIIYSLYKFDPVEEQWTSYYVTQRALSSRIQYLEFVLIALLSIGVGYIADEFLPSSSQSSWTRLKHAGVPTDVCLSVIFTAWGIFLVFWLLRLVVVKMFVKHYRSTTYWFGFIKAKKKLALFCATVLYQPIAKNILSNFSRSFYKFDSSISLWVLGKRQLVFPECMRVIDRNQTFTDGQQFCCQSGMPDRPCLTSFGDLEWYHFVSVILFFVYILGIPYSMYHLVARGTQEINTNFQVTQQLAITQAKDKELIAKIKAAPSRRERKELKKQRKANREAFDSAWSKYCREYRNAQSYLYFSYTYQKRFYKVTSIVEKLLLLCISLFFASMQIDPFKIIAGNAVVFGSFLLGVVAQPFSDGMEDLLDSSCRFTNAFNGFVGVLAQHVHMSPQAENLFQSTGLGLVNILNLTIVILILLGAPLRIFWKRHQARKEHIAKQKLAKKWQKPVLASSEMKKVPSSNTLPEMIASEPSVPAKPSAQTGRVANITSRAGLVTGRGEAKIITEQHEEKPRIEPIAYDPAFKQSLLEQLETTRAVRKEEAKHEIQTSEPEAVQPEEPKVEEPARELKLEEIAEEHKQETTQESEPEETAQELKPEVPTEEPKPKRVSIRFEEPAPMTQKSDSWVASEASEEEGESSNKL